MQRSCALEVAAFVTLLLGLGCNSNPAPAPAAAPPPAGEEQAPPARATTVTAGGSTGHEIPNGKKIVFKSPNANTVYDVVVDPASSTGRCAWDPAGTATPVTVSPGNPQTCTFTANDGRNGVLVYTINFTSPPSPPTPVQYSVISCKGC